MSQRKNIMLGTAGHVDHGKTAVVRMLTGCNTDTLAEEQKRGLTIDIGFAPCRMSDQNVIGVIDVPGHVDFIRNMVAGAQGIDVVIFVVAADDGVMPQTREHLDILTLMGARGGIVALTKIDLVQPDMRELVVEDIRSLLSGTFLADAPICPISNISGEGYDNFIETLNRVVAECPDRKTSGLFRVWIEDVYAIKGFGTVVTGIPLSGQVRVGDRLLVLPRGEGARVRKLEVYGQESEIGRAGECVAINISDVSAEGLGRGMVLVEGESYKPSTMIEARLALLPHAARALKDLTQVQLNIGTAEALAAVAMLEAKTLEPGGSQMVQLRLNKPLPAAPGDRFVIRADLGGPTAGHLTTIGGGRVLSTSDIRLRRNRPWTISALQELDSALDASERWCVAHLRQAKRAMSAGELASAMHVKPEEALNLLPRLIERKVVLLAGAGQYVHSEIVDELKRRVAEELEKFHAANPLRLGIELADLAATLQAPKELLELAIASLLSDKAIERQGSVLLLAGKSARLSDRDRQVCAQIEQSLKAALLQPPLLPELAAQVGAKEAHVEQLARLLVDQGVLVKLDERLYMHRDAVAAAKKVALELFARGGSFETVVYRDALAVSRKFAVPLLDYLDTIRFTARSGNRRSPGVEARKLLEPKPPA